MLRTSGHLLAVAERQLQLRLSLSVVQATLEQAVSRSLARAIGQGGPGVERGIFRGPTLRVTNRWISVEPLLAGTVGIQLGAFVLAVLVALALQATYYLLRIRAGSWVRPLALFQGALTTISPFMWGCREQK